MKSTATRTACQMTRGADHVGWLAFADQAEEQGETATASLWRLRAGILAILQEAAANPPENKKSLSRAIGDIGTITFRGTPKRIQIVLRLASGEYLTARRIRPSNLVCNWAAFRTSLRPDNTKWLRDVAIGHTDRLLAAVDAAREHAASNPQP